MKKILVPVDGSKASIKAAKTAIEIAQKEGSSLTLITVVPDAARNYGPAVGKAMLEISGELKKVNEASRTNAKKALDKIIEESIPQGFDVEKIVTIGSVADEIVNEAETGKYDLIVIGRRGLSKTERFFVGSVTQRVLAGAPCAVYVEKEDAE